MSLSGKLKLLTDENIPKLVFEFLANKGFDVRRSPLRSKDEFISRIAKTEGRIILSFDRHFGNILLFPPEEHDGIVFIRIVPPVTKTVTDALSDLFDKVKPSEFKGKLFVLTPFRFRIYPPRRTK